MSIIDCQTCQLSKFYFQIVRNGDVSANGANGQLKLLNRGIWQAELLNREPPRTIGRTVTVTPTYALG